MLALLCSADFWSIFLTVIGLVFSFGAYIEARGAKQEAKLAGEKASSFVKVQTNIITLTQFSDQFCEVNEDINFIQARNMLSKIQSKICELKALYSSNTEVYEIIKNLDVEIKKARTALNEVKPADNKEPLPTTVYYAIEGFFDSISSMIGQLSGQFQKMNHPY